MSLQELHKSKILLYKTFSNILAMFEIKDIGL